MADNPLLLSIRPGYPDFLQWPWYLPLAEWQTQGVKLENIPIGICRHSVVFVKHQGLLYALKELPDQLAQQEYQLLRRLEELDLPAVTPVGYVECQGEHPRSILITRFLDYAVPYRILFVQSEFESYREHLLDAVTSLLVQLHLSGIFWGDCSLSNALFRQDAGRLQAYLVDAETSESHESLSEGLRSHELDIMEENISGTLADLAAAGELPADYPIFETGASIRERYQRLWDEINHSEKISSDQKFRIQERIRKLNELGFSVDEVLLKPLGDGERLQFKVMVTDRHFHKNLLQGLTGLEAEELQARCLINEIQEIRVGLSQQQNRSTPLSIAAQVWLNNTYQPLLTKLQTKVGTTHTPLELYCLMLDHKWYLSEQRGQDVGHQKALADFLSHYSSQINKGQNESPDYPSKTG